MEKSDLALNRRTFLGAVGAGALGLGLAACGSSSPSGSSGTTAPKNGSSAKLPDWLSAKAKSFSGRTLNVIASQQYFQTTNTDFVNTCQAFASQTGTTVNVSVLNVDTGNLVPREDAAVKAGNPPDCAFIDPSRFAAQYYQLGDIVPVNSAVNEMVTHYGQPMSINELYLKLGPSKDWYGIPFFSLINGWFARKDWLKEKGIKDSEFASGAMTLDKLRDLAVELTDTSQQRYGWGLTYNNSGDGGGTISWVLNAYGASVNDDTGTKVIFGEGKYAEPTQEAINWLVQTYSNPKYTKALPPGVFGWGDPSNNEAWLAGTIAFTQNAYSLYAQSKATGNPVYNETLLFNGPTGPAVKRPLLFGSSEAFVVFKGAKEPQLAEILAQYVAYGQGFLQMVKDSVGLVLPAYDQVWHSDKYYLNGDPAFKPQYAGLTQPVPVATSTGLHFPQTASAPGQAVTSTYVLNDMLGDIVNKKATMSEAISTAQQRMKSIFEQQGFPQGS